MKLFSEREGLKRIRTEIQVNSMDDALRNRLWNVFEVYFIESMYGDSRNHVIMQALVKEFYDSYLKRKVAQAPRDIPHIKGFLSEFFSKATWYSVYDFLEFLISQHPDEDTNEGFMKTCNEVLESELSAYRFAGGQITRITSEEEISEIEEALETPLKHVRTHLENSLKLLSDRKSPDYRNSIKESISSVEAICRLITKNDKATLGQALKQVENKVGLHRALKNAFSSLYGYTSSAEGIRHALLEEPRLSFEDAKFMLVSCSAFINYLVSKAEKAKIKL